MTSRAFLISQYHLQSILSYQESLGKVQLI